MRKLLKITSCTVLLVAGLSGSAWAGYDKPYVGDQKIYIAKHEDTLVHIARYFEMGFVEMRAANPHVDPWIPGDGTKMILPSRHILPDADHKGIVINLPEMRLYAFVNGDEAPSTFPLGVGREGLETPIGKTKVVRKKEGPQWRPTARMRKEDPELPEVVEPGPDNPLGTHALYLGWPTYAMHGTNKPYGIGRRISSGCIRLYPENITQLFEMIPVGTPVQVVNQPIKLAWIDDVLYLEAHPDMDQAIQMEETGQIYTAKMSDDALKQILKAAGEYKDKLHWATIRNAVRDRSGYPVMIARKEGGKIDDSFEVIDGDDVELLFGADADKKKSEGASKDAEERLAQADEDKDDRERRAKQVLTGVYGDEDDEAARSEEEQENGDEKAETDQVPNRIVRTLNP